MRLSSGRAYQQVKEQLLADPSCPVWARQFFDLADFFRLTPRITRSLVDSTRTLDARVKLFRQVQPVGQLEERVAQSIEQILAQRIPQPEDLVEITEELGLELVIRQAQQTSQLEQLTDQLFSIWQVLEEYPQLRNALADRKGVPLSQRTQMIQELFGDQLAELSMLLFERAIATAMYANPKKQRVSISSLLRHYQHRLVAAKDNVLAVVTSAQPLSEAQKTRIANILQDRYQRPIYLEEQIDAKLVGGVQIQIGAEIYDGSIATALKQTKEEIAG